MNFFKKFKEYESLKPGLSRIRRFLKVFDNPQDKIKTVHVAGTNGKGSCAAFIAEILKTSGYKTGLYTSPHLVNIEERIKINNLNISRSTFKKYVTKYSQKALECNLSYFEYLTALAFIYLNKQKVDIAVIETGLGGRLDATNVLNYPLVCVITSISKDHCEILGNTIEKITYEKAGILKKNASIVCGKLPKAAIDIIKDRAKNNVINLYYKDFKMSNFRISLKGQSFSYVSKSLCLENLRLKLLGNHQVINASGAINAVECLIKRGFTKINFDSIRKGLKNTYWPARFEIKKINIGNSNLKIIIDGAHNEEGLKAFIYNFKQLGFGRSKKVFIFASMKEKNYRYMIKNIAPFAKKVILPEIKNCRAESVLVLKEEFLKYISKRNIFTVKSIREAINLAKSDKNVVCVGSLYLAGQVLANI